MSSLFGFHVVLATAVKEGGKLQEGGLWEGRCSNCTVSVSSDEVTAGLCWAPRL